MSNFKFPVAPTHANLDKYLSKKNSRPFGYATTVTKEYNTITDETFFIIRQHGNAIAEIALDYLWMSNQHYGTPTTRTRLNKVLGANNIDAYVTQRKFVQILVAHQDEYLNFVSAYFERNESGVFKYVC